MVSSESKLVERLVEDYKGWHIICHQQVLYPKYKPYMAICSRDISKNRTIRFTLEGSTLKQALVLAKERIDDGDYDARWDKDVKLSPCVFLRGNLSCP